jgi:hypothetical protein
MVCQEKYAKIPPMDGEPDPKAAQQNPPLKKKRPGFIRRFFGLWLLVFGVNPGYKPWEEDSAAGEADLSDEKKE